MNDFDFDCEFDANSDIESLGNLSNYDDMLDFSEGYDYEDDLYAA